MSFVVAHAAHAFLEAALFAPAGVAVTAAIARGLLRRRDDAPEIKESP